MIVFFNYYFQLHWAEICPLGWKYLSEILFRLFQPFHQRQELCFHASIRYTDVSPMKSDLVQWFKVSVVNGDFKFHLCWWMHLEPLTVRLEWMKF